MSCLMAGSRTSKMRTPSDRLSEKIRRDSAPETIGLEDRSPLGQQTEDNAQGHGKDLEQKDVAIAAPTICSTATGPETIGSEDRKPPDVQTKDIARGQDNKDLKRKDVASDLAAQETLPDEAQICVAATSQVSQVVPGAEAVPGPFPSASRDDSYDPTTRQKSSRSIDWPEIVQVKAKLVEEQDEEAPPVVVAAERSDFFIDTKSARVRWLGLLACLVVIGAVAGGAYAATRKAEPGPAPEVIVVSSPTTYPTFSPTASPTIVDWHMVGQEVLGENGNDRFGWSVSISSDGTRFASSAPSNPKIIELLEGEGAELGTLGLVTICTEIAGDWQCKKLPNPSGDRDALASLVSLSGDGNVVAVGYSRTSIDAVGFVRIFKFDEADSEWKELGDDIVGGKTEARFGGTFQWFDDDGVVYEYDRDVVAQPVTSISLSGDGKTVAIGSPKDTAGGLPNVSVYRYDDANLVWDQVGDTLSGVDEDDFFGQSISLSANGEYLAIGAPRAWNGPKDNDDNYYDASGIVAVYMYDDADNLWNQIGQNLEGISVEDYPRDARYGYFGDSVSLSADGAIVATAAPYRSRYDSNDNCEGLVKVHKYSKSKDEWEQYGELLWQNGGYGDVDNCEKIAPTYENDSGYIVSLSGDGSRLAVGMVGSTPKRLDNGEVHVFQYEEDSDSWLQIGSSLVGNDGDFMEGWSVSLSSMGDRLAVGAPLSKIGGNEKGMVRVFDFGGAPGITEKEVIECSKDELKFELMLTVDVYGEQTRWRVLDKNNSIPLQGGPYLSGFVETYHIAQCLTVDCYLFSIYDDEIRYRFGGDGLTERGGYKILVDDLQIVNGGTFGEREETFIGNCDGINVTAAFPKYCEYAGNEIGDGKCNAQYNTEECGFDRGDCTAFNEEFPFCSVDEPENIGNNACESDYNHEDCGWDGGDCNLYNSLPNCSAYDPALIGDGTCNGKYNTVECNFDGLDCTRFNRKYPYCTLEDAPENIGNGDCDSEYNTMECDWDGGDCDAFNAQYLGCDVKYPSWVGDGYCDEGEYNTTECGWDGGDCESPDED